MPATPKHPPLDESFTYNTGDLLEALHISREVKRVWYDYLRALAAADDYPEIEVAPCGSHFIIRGEDVRTTLRRAQLPEND